MPSMIHRDNEIWIILKILGAYHAKRAPREIARTSPNPNRNPVGFATIETGLLTIGAGNSHE